MPTNQTHTITTIADLLGLVNADNLASLCADMQGLLMNAAMTKALVSAVSEQEAANMFENAAFTWTDDGINEQSIIAQAEGSEKGLEFKVKGPKLKA